VGRAMTGVVIGSGMGFVGGYLTCRWAAK
jgi:hypothetical protein